MRTLPRDIHALRRRRHRVVACAPRGRVADAQRMPYVRRMGRPLKDRRGLDERWRMTTVRVPRWLADQLRDLARARGHEETWITLVEAPGVQLPGELPPRYAHLVRPKGD